MGRFMGCYVNIIPELYVGCSTTLKAIHGLNLPEKIVYWGIKGKCIETTQVLIGTETGLVWLSPV